MAFPSVRSSSSGEGSGSGGGSGNVVVVMPPTISAGDLLLVAIAQDGLNLFDAGDSGFTLLGSYQHSSGQVSLAVFWKKAAGDEDGANRGFHGTASLDFAWVAYCFQDAADPTVTPPTLSSVLSGTDGTVELPTCSPGVGVKDFYWLGVAGCDRRNFTAYPADLTLNRLTAGTVGLFNASAAGAGEQSAAASYSPAGSFTISSSDEWISYTLGIHPVGGIPPTEVPLGLPVRTRTAPPLGAYLKPPDTSVILGLPIRTRTAPPLSPDLVYPDQITALLIGGEEYPIRWSTFRLDDILGGRSTGHVTVVDAAASFDLRPGMPVEVWLSSERLFAGYLAEGLAIVPLTADGSARYWETDLVDHHSLCDKRTIYGAWDEISARDLVDEIVDGWLADEGITFDYDGHDPGPTLRRTVFNYVPASVALSRIADLAGWWWRVDGDKALEMRPRETYAAPWTADPSNCEWKRSRAALGTLEYRNRQFVKGGTAATEEQTEQFVGDGSAQTFSVAYPIVRVPAVSVDTGGGYTPATVGIRGVETGFDWYWSKDSPQISQDTGGTPLDAGEYLQVEYVGGYPLIVRSDNEGEIYLRSLIDGSSGIVSAVATEAAADSAEAAFARAAALLGLYCQTGRRVTLRTRRGGLRPGMLLPVSIPALGLSGDGMLIERIQTSARSSLWVEYTVEAVEGPASKGWAEWFAAARRDLSGAYEASATADVVQIMEMIAETWGWFSIDFPAVYACPIPAVDLYPDVSLYPC